MPPVNKNKKVARTHGDSLLIVCAVCWRKKGSVRPVTDKMSGLICQFVFEDYSKDNGVHPSVICDGCRKTLGDIDKVRKLNNNM